jgi:hypothetical protein
MTLTTETFEGIDDGTVMPSGDYYTGGVITSGQTVQAATAAAITGSRGLRFTNSSPGTVAYLEHTFDAATPAFSWACRMRMPAPPTSSQMRLGQFMAGAITTIRLDHNSDGRLLIRNAAASTITAASMASAITVGTPVSLQIFARKGTTTTDGMLRVRMVRLDTDTELYDSGLLTNINTGTADYTADRIGWVTTTSAGITGLDVDDVALDTAPAADGDLIDPPATSDPPTIGDVTVLDRAVADYGDLSTAGGGGDLSWTIEHLDGPDESAGITEPIPGLFLIPRAGTTSRYTVTVTEDGSGLTGTATVTVAPTSADSPGLVTLVRLGGSWD